MLLVIWCADGGSHVVMLYNSASYIVETDYEISLNLLTNFSHARFVKVIIKV